ncbi:precursor of CEP3-like [Senna tora]|uniref:Precursor of CEP3-like n=1 Tax=Senna tora TaxID=362788 RepID=A0A834ST32_9FABA|nr:precursor of CEP3-like [Senna tora]
MAQNKPFISLIFFALILCQAFQCIDAIRNLKFQEPYQNHMHGGLVVTTTAINTSPPTPPSAAAPGHNVDDFRPTAPGHSPGVGHSVHN